MQCYLRASYSQTVNKPEKKKKKKKASKILAC